MNDDEKAGVVVQVVLYLVIPALLLAGCLFIYGYNRGERHGTCVELCRPAKFDSDQSVNGGCLCIGSDKVLRIKP
jgi:hypothetical protein